MSEWLAGPGFRVYPDKVNISDRVVDRHVDAGRGDNVAVLWDGGSWTYAELQAEIERVTAGYAAIGLCAGDKLVVRSRNIPEAIAAVLAGFRYGAVPVWANTLLKEEEVAYIVDNSEARFAITMSELAGPLRNLKADGKLDQIVILDGAAEGEGEHAYANLRAGGGAKVIADTEAMDPAFMLYSSGTTGRPKGILHAHRWIITVGDPSLVQTEYTEDDRILTPGEFSFMGTFAHAFLFPLYRGASIALFSQRATPEAAFAAVNEFQATILMSVPTLYRAALADASLRERFDISRLRYTLSTGEFLGGTVYEQWLAAYGMPIYEVYGVSELEVFVGNGPAFDVKPGSIGKGLLGIKIALLDDSLNEVPDGEEGVMMIHRSDPGLFLGYYRDPERWVLQHRGEWYDTGDVMRRDEDGYYWFLGRNDDLFKSRGYLLSPQEIENALLRHPAVAEVAVIGIPDEIMGNLVAAYVVPTADAETGDALAEEIMETARSLIAPYKVPKTVTFRDALPKNPVGKIVRRTLKDEVRAASLSK
ncbi:MAG: acyl-CoA synthetase [Rhodospirillales bacterium]|nr:acyl-CoA synthetase [Rhodospirillales bacterium]